MTVIKKIPQKGLPQKLTRRSALSMLGMSAALLPILGARGFAVAAEGKKAAVEGRKLPAPLAPFWKKSNMDVMTAIFSRRSYRDFTGAPISQSDMDAILACGMAAPSAKASRPWEFVVTSKPKRLKEISQILPALGYALKASAAVFVLFDSREQPGSHLAPISTALSVQNMMLAAEALGYGSVWVEMYPHEERIAAGHMLTGAPDYMKTLCLLLIGKPTVRLPAENNANPQKVHYDTW